METSRGAPRRMLQKLVKNGGSTQVTIPRPLLFALGWLTGQPVILELTEERTLHVRPLDERDLMPRGRVGLLPDPPATVKP